jgi:hypothetical protein
MVYLKKFQKQISEKKNVIYNNKRLTVQEVEITSRRAKVDNVKTNLKVKEFIFHSTDKNFTMKDAMKLINMKSFGLQNKGYKGYISSNISTGFGWKSSTLKPIGYQVTNAYNNWGTNNIEIENQFNDNDDEANIEKYYENENSKVDSFRIFLYDFPEEAGCNGKYNDCVFDALKRSFGEQFCFDSPVEFKKFLGIERKAKVPFDMIDRIESKIKSAINVEGDYTRASTLTTKRQINLIWQDGHVELKRTNTPIKCKNLKHEKKPLVYFRDRTDKKNPVLKVYDGIEERTISDEEFNNYFFKYNTSPYIVIPKTKKQTLKETFDYFILANYKLKELTKPHLSQINLCKTGTYKDTAIKLFNDLNQSLPDPEDITQLESEWILGCYRGGKQYSEDGYEGHLYKSDIKAMYPFIQKSNMYFPIKQGQFKIVTDSDCDKFFSYGIYRAKIKYNSKFKTVFHFNDNDYYTFIEMERARKLNLKVELIQDGKPNFLFYPPEARIEGKLLFKPFIDYLMKLETPDIKNAVKSIRNVLWGALSERKITVKYEDENEKINLESTEQIIGMKTNKDGISYPMVINQNEQFKTNYARISPFITAKARTLLSEFITENIKDLSTVKRTHTDSIFTTEDISKVFPRKDDKNAEIGMMLYEGYNPNVKIINMNTMSNDNWEL